MFSSSFLRAAALARGHKQAFYDYNFFDYTFFTIDNDLSLAKKIQDTTTENCEIILGLLSSRECLMFGPMLKKSHLIGISAGCSHDGIKNTYPHLYTITPPISEFSNKIVSHLHEEKANSAVVAIYQPTDVFSNAGFNLFKKKLNIPILEVPIASDGQVDLTELEQLRNKNITFVFFTYPLPSAEVLVSLNAGGLISSNVKIIGASSWIFDASVLKSVKPILSKAKEVIAPTLLNWETVTHTTLFHQFNQKDKKVPLVMELLIYDSTALAIDCYKKSIEKSTYKIELVQACIEKNFHNGLTGEYSFKKTAPFASRPIYLTNMLDRI